MSVLALALFYAAPVLASPEVKLIARAQRPGEAVLIAVSGHHLERAPSGALAGRALSFFPGAPGVFLALGGLDLELSTGTQRVELTLWEPEGRRHFWASDLIVRERRFPTVALRVQEKFVHPPKAEEERAERESSVQRGLFERRTPKRHLVGRFHAPIRGAPSSRFGERRVFNGVPRAPHSGADLKARHGAPVAASENGEVVFAGELFFGGKTVILDHGYGIFSSYSHLSEISVEPGRLVARGARVGKVGATGRATGPHLHWGFKLQGARVDPFSLTALELEPWLASPAASLRPSKPKRWKLRK